MITWEEKSSNNYSTECYDWYKDMNQKVLWKIQKEERLHIVCVWEVKEKGAGTIVKMNSPVRQGNVLALVGGYAKW